MRSSGRIQKKNAIVTGGGNGIGKAIAERFAKEGARVIITDCNRQDGISAAEGSESISYCYQNVTAEKDWQKLIKFARDQFTQIDILVNNAGILATETSQVLEDTSLKQWRTIQAVNSEGVFLGCKYGVEAMRETGGSIINLSSIAGLIGSPHLVAYGASKGLVRQLTKSIAVHCGREGYRIRCNSIHPGIIRTKMQDQVVALNGGDIDAKWNDRINLIPLGEAGTTEDIANGALFLASDEARHITGAELVIDGGMTII